jgi:hypothetical protein
VPDERPAKLVCGRPGNWRGDTLLHQGRGCRVAASTDISVAAREPGVRANLQVTKIIFAYRLVSGCLHPSHDFLSNDLTLRLMARLLLQE